VEPIDLQLQTLMARSLAGDRGAYLELLRALAPRLRAYFRRRLTDPSEAEDLVQETLIAIHAKRDTYDPRLPFAPWAYTVARHKLIDHLRRMGARPTAPLEDAELLIGEDLAEAGEARIDLARLLKTLPDRQRRLIEDIRLRGLSVAEAAARHGYSEGAAKVAVHRSLKTLAAKVSADEDR
jgi:RNA polymerase sigma-70 factor (ECF subfamily)